MKLTPSAGLTPRLSTASDESHRLRELIVRAPRTCLYLHLPFCPSLCPYCDFAVVVGSHDKHGEYLVAVKQEMRHRRQQDNWDALHTLFLGGGTPTFIPAKQIAALLEGTQDIFGWRPDIEVSVEANPETIDDESMRILAAAGVNRVSIGAQSFDNNVLKELGRNHDASLLPRAVDMVRNAGIERINLDLIYGSTSETDASWERSVKAALDTGVTHLSVYALTIEDRTVFGKRAQTGAIPYPDEDVLADRYLQAIQMIEATGLRQYEVSNFAKPGHECRHNLGVWCGADYLGVGLGAHSLRISRRWANTRNLTQYLSAPESSIDSDDIQDSRARAEDWLSVRIRLRAGFPEAVAEALLPGLSERAEPLIRNDLLERIDGYLRTTDRGMLLENEVTLRLIGPAAS